MSPTKKDKGGGEASIVILLRYANASGHKLKAQHVSTAAGIGKSTAFARISKAKPNIADKPTTSQLSVALPVLIQYAELCGLKLEAKHVATAAEIGLSTAFSRIAQAKSDAKGSTSQPDLDPDVMSEADTDCETNMEAQADVQSNDELLVEAKPENVEAQITEPMTGNNSTTPDDGEEEVDEKMPLKRKSKTSPSTKTPINKADAEVALKIMLAYAEISKGKLSAKHASAVFGIGERAVFTRIAAAKKSGTKSTFTGQELARAMPLMLKYADASGHKLNAKHLSAATGIGERNVFTKIAQAKSDAKMEGQSPNPDLGPSFDEDESTRRRMTGMTVKNLTPTNENGDADAESNLKGLKRKANATSDFAVIIDEYVPRGAKVDRGGVNEKIGEDNTRREEPPKRRGRPPKKAKQEESSAVNPPVLKKEERPTTAIGTSLPKQYSTPKNTSNPVLESSPMSQSGLRAINQEHADSIDRERSVTLDGASDAKAMSSDMDNEVKDRDMMKNGHSCEIPLNGEENVQAEVVSENDEVLSGIDTKVGKTDNVFAGISAAKVKGDKITAAYNSVTCTDEAKDTEECRNDDIKGVAKRSTADVLPFANYGLTDIERFANATYVPWATVTVEKDYGFESVESELSKFDGEISEPGDRIDELMDEFIDMEKGEAAIDEARRARAEQLGSLSQ